MPATVLAAAPTPERVGRHHPEPARRILVQPLARRDGGAVTAQDLVAQRVPGVEPQGVRVEHLLGQGTLGVRGPAAALRAAG